MDRSETQKEAIKTVIEARTYEMRGYRLLMYVAVVVVTAILGTLAVDLTARGEIGVAAIAVAAWALWIFVGSRAQGRTPYRLTVSATGLYAETLLGTVDVRWADVRRIQFLRSRWTASRIRQVEIASAGDRHLMLYDRLTQFDDLVAQLRQVRPHLIQE
jgi:hypothetical protein